MQSYMRFVCIQNIAADYIILLKLGALFLPISGNASDLPLKRGGWQNFLNI